MLEQRRHLAITSQFRTATFSKSSENGLRENIDTADYSGPVCPEHRKPHTFSWERHSRQCGCLTNDTAMIPRRFKPQCLLGREKKGTPTLSLLTDDSLLSVDNEQTIVNAMC